MKTKVAIFCVVIALLGMTASAQDTNTPPATTAPANAASANTYGLGDQIFSITVGGIIPLFFQSLTGGGITPATDHLTLGATGYLKWAAYLNPNMTLGAELGGMFATTILDRTLVMLPIMAEYTYVIPFYPFELRLSAGLGGTFIKLDTDLYFGPLVRPGVSFYWNYNSQWAFGLRVEYWWSPEFYFSQPLASESTAGNFLTVMLSTLYHF